MQRAFNARNHAEIVPEVTQEELEVLTEQRRLLRTHFLDRRANEVTLPKHDCGRMDEICDECGAKHFKKIRNCNSALAFASMGTKISTPSGGV